ncbi:MAG: hypothetical protein ACYDBJ_25790 [Aggregatilineales bacterium]
MRTLEPKDVLQVVTFFGNGKLLDGNETSVDFRNFLSCVSSESLQRYAQECLDSPSKEKALVGFAFQDVVNQIGRRLSFLVGDGRYKGTTKDIGYDGLWISAQSHEIVVEVKVSDVYSIDLDVIASYRNSVVGDNDDSSCSVLIVVGREDTGSLEAQIRGSRHAWEIRLISIDALIQLMFLRESVEDHNIVQRIHSILIPREFTKLDEIVEVLFSTAEEVREVTQADGEADSIEEEAEPIGPGQFRQDCILRIQEYVGHPLVKRSYASYASPDNETAVVCAVSKAYEFGPGQINYWFTFHPRQKEFLEQYNKGFVALGCGFQDAILLIPISTFSSWLSQMPSTVHRSRASWHVHIQATQDKWTLKLQDHGAVDLTGYRIKTCLAGCGILPSEKHNGGVGDAGSMRVSY